MESLLYQALQVVAYLRARLQIHRWMVTYDPAGRARINSTDLQGYIAEGKFWREFWSDGPYDLTPKSLDTITVKENPRNEWSRIKTHALWIMCAAYPQNWSYVDSNTKTTVVRQPDAALKTVRAYLDTTSKLGGEWRLDAGQFHNHVYTRGMRITDQLIHALCIRPDGTWRDTDRPLPRAWTFLKGDPIIGIEVQYQLGVYIFHTLLGNSITAMIPHGDPRKIGAVKHILRRWTTQ